MLKPTSKYFLPILFLIIGLIVGLVGKSLYLSTKESEKSYKGTGTEPRFLTEFRKVDPTLPADNSSKVAGAVAKTQAIQSTFEQAGKLATQFDWFSAIKSEHIFVYVTNLGNLRFTLDIDKGKYSVKPGFDTSKKPTMIVPLPEDAIQSLVLFLQDGKLSYDEQYKIYGFLSVPALQALYNNDKLYEPGDKSPLKFDNLVQIEIPPKQPITLYGNPYVIQVTAVNVDGQWIVFPGLQGDPDFRMTMTLDQATQLYTMGVYDVRDISTVQQALDLSKRFLKFRDSTLTYVRSDHQKASQ